MIFIPLYSPEDYSHLKSTVVDSVTFLRKGLKKLACKMQNVMKLSNAQPIYSFRKPPAIPSVTNFTKVLILLWQSPLPLKHTDVIRLDVLYGLNIPETNISHIFYIHRFNFH